MNSVCPVTRPKTLLFFLFLSKVSQYLLWIHETQIVYFIRNSIKSSMTSIQYNPIYTAKITFSWFFVRIFHWEILIVTKFKHLTQTFAITNHLIGPSPTVSLLLGQIFIVLLSCQSILCDHSITQGLDRLKWVKIRKCLIHIWNTVGISLWYSHISHCLKLSFCLFLFPLQDYESLEYRNSILFTFESPNVQDYHNVQVYYNPDQEISAVTY